MKPWLVAALMAAGLLLTACAASSQKFDYSETIRDRLSASISDAAATATDSLDFRNAALPDLLAYAALNNAALKTAYYQWQGEVSKIARAKALPNPNISFAWFIKEVETRVGPQQQRIGFSQMVPWFGKLKLQGEVAARSAEAAQWQFESQKLTLYYDVKAAAYEYAFLRRAAEVVAQNEELLSFLEAVVRTKYRSGRAPHSSLIKIQVELDKLKDRRQNLLDMIRPQQARLNAALHRPAAAPLPETFDIPESYPAVNDSTWIIALRQKNPELLAADQRINAAAAGKKLARKTNRPEFMIGVDYIFTGEALNPQAPESGKDPLVAMLGMNLPLWPGKNRANIEVAEANYQVALNRREASEDMLAARLEMALYRLREARRKIALYGESLIPRSTQAFNVSRSAFEAGEVDFLELIDAQRTLLEFEILLEREKTNFQQRLAELEMLTGSELSDPMESRRMMNNE